MDTYISAYIDRLKRHIPRRLTVLAKRILRPLPYPVRLYPPAKHPRGYVLYSYLPESICLAEDAPLLNGHSALWESREIAHIFANLGYVVEAIHWADQRFVPKRHYDIVFDICLNLGRLMPYFNKQVTKILHCTGSDPYYQNSAELRRVEAVNARRKGHYKPKRIVANPQLATYSLQVADACSLIGSEFTKMTYPEAFRSNITPVTVSASKLDHEMIKSPSEFVPEKREFLWFFGGGAVHKGLDLALEVFARNPDLTLNVVGNVAAEPDFMEMYKRELMHSPNIRYHGPLLPNSDNFKRIVHDTFCFVAPSCSEGLSPAVATCLQIGLYPLISRDTGVELPPGCGFYLETCSITEIEQAVLTSHQMDKTEIIRQTTATQTYALRQFSRENFRQRMQNFIFQTLTNRGMLS
jgi:glycosyltransferase involved in cell wall biosynthesis